MLIVLSAGLARILNQFTAIRLHSQMHSDQFCPPTPPLSHHFTLSEK